MGRCQPPVVDLERQSTLHAWLFLEAVVLVTALPLLTFPSRLSVVALVLLPVVWLLRLILRRREIRSGPSDWPLAGLLLMTSVGLYASVDLQLSLPKLDGLILGYFAFSAIVANRTARVSQRLVGAALVVAGVGISLVSLVGTSWGTKLPFLQGVYAVLPHLIRDIPTSGGFLRDGFNPNEVGGTLALLFPFALALAVFAQRWLKRVALVPVLALLALTLLLTASRSAGVGVAFAILLIAALCSPRLSLAVPIVVLGSLAAAFFVGLANVRDLFGDVSVISTVGDSLIGRGEIWSRALAEIGDFPITGVGLNTFPVVTDLLYPFFDAAPNPRVPHAHNLFLQTALDLGVPGLACFFGILTASAKGLVDCWKNGSPAERSVAAGLGSGLVAHLVFSLTDAITLGAKPGILLWVMLGTAVAIGFGARGKGVGPANASRRAVHWIQWGLFAVSCGLAILVTLVPLGQLR